MIGVDRAGPPPVASPPLAWGATSNEVGGSIIGNNQTNPGFDFPQRRGGLLPDEQIYEGSGAVPEGDLAPRDWNHPY